MKQLGKWLGVSLACAFALALCIYLLPTHTQAAIEGYYTYTVEDGAVAITDCSTSINGNIVIPSTLGGYPVTVIGNYAFSNCSSLTGVTIPNSVITIGDNAFSSCYDLTSIHIPDSVKTIGYDAFSFTALTSVTIPASVTAIGSSPFTGCDKLTGIWVDAQNANYCSDSVGALYSKDKTQLIQIPGTVTEYVVPDGVISIGSAFYVSGALTRVTIPGSVITIGKSAFSLCKKLSSITLQEGITTVDANAFGNCSGLESIVFPESVTFVGKQAFWQCTKLKSVVIPNSTALIGEEAFIYCNNLTNVTIPAVPSMQQLFDEEISPKLASITITGGEIAEKAFSGCIGVTEIILRDGVTGIGNYGFNNCGIVAITIPDSVTGIGEGAFMGCDSLVSVTLPDSISAIGKSAFYGCKSLKSITVPAGVPAIEDQAFYGCTGLEEITLPDSVTRIGNYAFYSCSSLKDIAIPDQVASLGAAVFQNCTSLTDSTIPAGITVIPGSTFKGCSGLINLNIPAGITKIDSYAFDGCSSLRDIHFGGTKAAWQDALSYSAYPPYQSRLHPNCPDPAAHWTLTTVAATCETGSYSCEVCPCDYRRNEVTGAALGHDVSQWMTTKEATCIAEGGRTGICARPGCGKSITETVPATEHICQNGFCIGCQLPEGLKYSVSNGEVTVTEYTGTAAALVIPVTIANCPVTTIGTRAFEWCTDLVSVTIPEGVTTIDSYAFYKCDRLSNIFYVGTQEEWAQITVESGNTPLETAKVYYDYAGQLPGDFDGDFELSDADALYLLRHTLFADRYPITGNGDVDNDGAITDGDALYLLRHTLFADRYPLYPSQKAE